MGRTTPHSAFCIALIGRTAFVLLSSLIEKTSSKQNSWWFSTARMRTKKPNIINVNGYLSIKSVCAILRKLTLFYHGCYILQPCCRSHNLHYGSLFLVHCITCIWLKMSYAFETFHLLIIYLFEDGEAMFFILMDGIGY